MAVGASRRSGLRRRTGIEPARPRSSASSVLKTAPPTRTKTPPPATLLRSGLRRSDARRSPALQQTLHCCRAGERGQLIVARHGNGPRFLLKSLNRLVTVPNGSDGYEIARSGPYSACALPPNCVRRARDVGPALLPLAPERGVPGAVEGVEHRVRRRVHAARPRARVARVEQVPLARRPRRNDVSSDSSREMSDSNAIDEKLRPLVVGLVNRNDLGFSSRSAVGLLIEPGQVKL